MKDIGKIIFAIFMILGTGVMLLCVIEIGRGWDREIAYRVKMDNQSKSVANRRALLAAHKLDILDFENGMMCYILEVTEVDRSGHPDTVALQCGKGKGDRWQGGGMYDPWAFEFNIERLSWGLKRIVRPEDPEYPRLTKQIRTTSAHGRDPAPRLPPEE